MAPSSSSPRTTSTPPHMQYALLAFPTPHILLVTLNRPKSLNCINAAGNAELHALWEWFDDEPSLRVAVLTGTGRAFCAGADLKEWNARNQTTEGGSSSTTGTTSSRALSTPPSGFGGLSRRTGKKPIICAVNGLCLGGGCEMVINADMVIASSRAVFGFPEVKRGVIALAGALPRVVRTIGKQRAMEMVLTGREVGAVEAERWGFVNEVVTASEPGSEGGEGLVVKRAVEIAREIANNSPDAVIVSREGVKLGWEGVGAEDGTRILMDQWMKRLYAGENMKEGLRAFVEKRPPKWVDSKL